LQKKGERKIARRQEKTEKKENQSNRGMEGKKKKDMRIDDRKRGNCSPSFGGKEIGCCRKKKTPEKRPKGRKRRRTTGSVGIFIGGGKS